SLWHGCKQKLGRKTTAKSNSHAMPAMEARRRHYAKQFRRCSGGECYCLHLLRYCGVVANLAQSASPRLFPIGSSRMSARPDRLDGPPPSWGCFGEVRGEIARAGGCALPDDECEHARRAGERRRIVENDAVHGGVGGVSITCGPDDQEVS